MTEINGLGTMFDKFVNFGADVEVDQMIGRQHAKKVAKGIKAGEKLAPATKDTVKITAKNSVFAKPGMVKSGGRLTKKAVALMQKHPNAGYVPKIQIKRDDYAAMMSSLIDDGLGYAEAQGIVDGIKFKDKQLLEANKAHMDKLTNTVSAMKKRLGLSENATLADVFAAKKAAQAAKPVAQAVAETATNAAANAAKPAAKAPLTKEAIETLKNSADAVAKRAARAANKPDAMALANQATQNAYSNLVRTNNRVAVLTKKSASAQVLEAAQSRAKELAETATKAGENLQKTAKETLKTKLANLTETQKEKMKVIAEKAKEAAKKSGTFFGKMGKAIKAHPIAASAIALVVAGATIWGISAKKDSADKAEFKAAA